jgi:hypothetical protein
MQEPTRVVFSVYPDAGDVGRATRSLHITTLLDPSVQRRIFD